MNVVARQFAHRRTGNLNKQGYAPIDGYLEYGRGTCEQRICFFSKMETKKTIYNIVRCIDDTILREDPDYETMALSTKASKGNLEVRTKH